MSTILNFFFKIYLLNSTFFWLRFVIYGLIVWAIFSCMTYFFYKKIYSKSKTLFSVLHKITFAKLYSIIVFTLLNSLILFYFIKTNGWKSFEFKSFSFTTQNSYGHLLHFISIYIFAIIYYIRLKNRIK
jgi:hypothetical protein